MDEEAPVSIYWFCWVEGKTPNPEYLFFLQKRKKLRFERKKEKKEVYSPNPKVPPGILLSSMPSTTIGFERWAVTSAVSSLNSFSA